MQTRTLLAAGLTATLAAAIALPAPAQAAPPAGSDWQHVKALPINTYIHVQARTRHSVCTLKAVADDSLDCEYDTGVGTKELTFQRDEIKTIKIAHRVRSAFIGAGVGAGAGATAGAIYARGNHYFAVPSAFAMIYGFVGLFAGAPTGYLKDFSASTVYRAP
jgi:hypothetical protein